MFLVITSLNLIYFLSKAFVKEDRYPYNVFNPQLRVSS